MDEIKLEFSTIAYSSFPVWLPAYQLDETIRRLDRIGYDAVEILAAAPHAYPPYLSAERRREIRAVFDSCRIELSGMLPAPGGAAGSNPASAEPAERAYALEQYRVMIDICAEWGGRTIIYVPGWYIFNTKRDEAWKWSLETLAQVAVLAEAQNLEVVIEPTPADHNLVETARDALDMLSGVGANNVGLMFDSFHALYRNEVPSDYVYAMGDKLRYIHISDNDRLAPGQGRGDFVGLVEALRDVEYSGYLSMEVGFIKRSDQADRVARESLEYMRRLLAEVPSRHMGEPSTAKADR